MTDTNEVHQLVMNLKHDHVYHKLMNRYKTPSFFDVVRVSRNENAHSSFLSWLFDPEESHALGDFPLRKFAELLAVSSMNAGSSGQFPSDYANLIISGAYSIKTYPGVPCSIRELKISNGRRIDIYLSFKILPRNGMDEIHFRIPVENKVYSSELNDQTTDYFSFASSECDVIQDAGEVAVPVLVYLTPAAEAGSLYVKNCECACKSAIQISYQGIMEYVLEPCIHMCQYDSTRFMLQQYLHCLTFPPTCNDESQQYGNRHILALSREEMNDITQLWKSHHRLLTLCLQVEVDEELPSAECADSLGDDMVAFIRDFASCHSTLLSAVSTAINKCAISEIQNDPAYSDYSKALEAAALKWGDHKGSSSFSKLADQILSPLLNKDVWEVSRDGSSGNWGAIFSYGCEKIEKSLGQWVAINCDSRIGIALRRPKNTKSLFVLGISVKASKPTDVDVRSALQDSLKQRLAKCDMVSQYLNESSRSQKNVILKEIEANGVDDVDSDTPEAAEANRESINALVPVVEALQEELRQWSENDLDAVLRNLKEKLLEETL